MANGNQQRCCVLGVCCAPGGEAQRAAMESWLLEKLPELFDAGGEAKVLETRLAGWLDELFADNPALTQKLGNDE